MAGTLVASTLKEPTMTKRYFPFESDSAFAFLRQLRSADDKDAALKAALNVPRDVKAMSGITPAQWEEAIVSAELLAARTQPSPHFKLPDGIDVHALSAKEVMLKTARPSIRRASDTRHDRGALREWRAAHARTSGLSRGGRVRTRRIRLRVCTRACGSAALKTSPLVL